MILCKNGHPNPDGTTYCRVCKQYIDSTVQAAEPTPQPEPVPPPPPPPPPEPEPGRPTVSLSESSLTSEPGGTASCQVDVENPGETPGDYTVAVDGRAAQWASLEPTTLSLAPGGRGSATLTFQLGTDAPAGAAPFEVEVASKDAAVPPTLVPGMLEVTAPTPALSGQLQPAVSKGHDAADLVLFLQNPTRTPLTASLSARDPAGVLAFDIEPETVIVPPGTGGSASLHLQAHKRSFVRGRKLPFEVLVAPEGGTTTKVEGHIRSGAIDAKAPWPPRPGLSGSRRTPRSRADRLPSTSSTTRYRGGAQLGDHLSGSRGGRGGRPRARRPAHTRRRGGARACLDTGRSGGRVHRQRPRPRNRADPSTSRRSPRPRHTPRRSVGARSCTTHSAGPSSGSSSPQWRSTTR